MTTRINPTGPRPFGAWVKLYEERDKSRFELTDVEELVFDRDHGFFTFAWDFEHKYLLIPKMCGDGKYWREKIYAMVVKLRTEMGCVGAYLCTKRKPEVYMRVLGGELVRQDYDEIKDVIYSYILVTPENTNVKGGH